MSHASAATTDPANPWLGEASRKSVRVGSAEAEELALVEVVPDAVEETRDAELCASAATAKDAVVRRVDEYMVRYCQGEVCEVAMIRRLSYSRCR